tara:strand:+ start:2444 stop:2899 length:456 start_codon:yes stop_codon:yes gene_type:complete
MNKTKQYKSILSIFLLNLSLYTTAQHLLVKDGFVRELPPKVRYTAAYFTLENLDQKAKKLIHISTPIAREVQLHETKKVKNEVFMERKQAFNIPAQGQLKLEPKAKHLMLIGLKKRLKQGDEVKFKLHFQDGSKQTMTLPIRASHTLHHHH